jgi:NCAIR mutase (PurE)-related protein
MNAPTPQALTDLARQFLGGQLSSEAYWQALTELTAAQLDQATLDLDRFRRCGYPEVIYGEGKTLDALVSIVAKLLSADQPVLVTRLTPALAESLTQHHPSAIYNAMGRTWRLPTTGWTTPRGRVAVVTAGTSDLPVAEEAAETLEWMGTEVLRIRDVGVAGPHRLISHVPKLRSCEAVVVVAGMEGALPSVVAGHVACPVVGVPTSVGYGANFGGVAALLSMLNSCAANVVVVNIDAGFKAGYVAGMIAQRTQSSHP